MAQLWDFIYWTIRNIEIEKYSAEPIFLCRTETSREFDGNGCQPTTFRKFLEIFQISDPAKLPWTEFIKYAHSRESSFRAITRCVWKWKCAACFFCFLASANTLGFCRAEVRVPPPHRIGYSNLKWRVSLAIWRESFVRFGCLNGKDN